MFYTHSNVFSGAIVTNHIPDGVILSKAVSPSGDDASTASEVPYAGVALTMAEVQQASPTSQGVRLPADAPTGATIRLFTYYADQVTAYAPDGEQFLIYGTSVQFNNAAPVDFLKVTSLRWLRM